ncbi:excisionase [Mangrovibacter plantisponsor]|uniref:Excisionase-like protein n=1 Tax=Mangrovibacter plantisponsor TaxID=451513 RepID=A0A317Q2Z1_9ENTR|nr:excisionase [Mangrovibacter plantisponsor]PWW09909.1 excisionase-like protein [Mangrovibacter plantisponsor]
MARSILLTEWAKEEFGAPVPSSATLSKYAKNGMIFPPPVKVGKQWRVEPSARYVGMTVKPDVHSSDHPLLRRILEDGETT